MSRSDESDTALSVFSIPKVAEAAVASVGQEPEHMISNVWKNTVWGNGYSKVATEKGEKEDWHRLRAMKTRACTPVCVGNGGLYPKGVRRLP